MYLIHLQAQFELYKSEIQPFRKVHRMIDLFESILKTYTAVIIAEYFRNNSISDPVKGLLVAGLRTPSLGIWQEISRTLFKERKNQKIGFLFEGFADNFKALELALNNPATNVISFRNGYAHGATPSDEQCLADINRFEPFLEQLMIAPWICESYLEVLNNNVFINFQGTSLNLHPIIVSREEGENSPFSFFNDLKDEKVGFLNYPLSKHYREKDFYEEFQKVIPLKDWKNNSSDVFNNRIEELTETFKGRLSERSRLLGFLKKENKGYLSVLGNPGIGKSALIAQFFKDLKRHENQNAVKNLQVVSYFIRRGQANAKISFFFNYLIRITDEFFPGGKNIFAAGTSVWDMQAQLFSKWRLWGEQRKGKRILFLIDGIDEGTEEKIPEYLPRETFDGILFIYGSRPDGHESIRNLWTQLPVENNYRIELSGLEKQDIRALLYEVANKYEIERESSWIDFISKRSQGNPLYLKLLCNAIENGSIKLNDENTLPESIFGYYDEILNRYSKENDADELLQALYVFSSAKDCLSFAHIGAINRVKPAALWRISGILREVLSENIQSNPKDEFQLFHESFREYLQKRSDQALLDANERIISFCSNWQSLQGSNLQTYALKYFAEHLAISKKSKRAEELIKLLYDTSFIDAQKKVLRGFEATKTLFREALLKASELNMPVDMLEAALSIADIYYEEQNDAPRIIELVANNEMDEALKRIEDFGGMEAEVGRRKFVLYMLCLLELTFLASKTKPHRKRAIELLLEHFDENLPNDIDAFNWIYFFPVNIVFQMASEWARLGLNFSVVFYNRVLIDESNQNKWLADLKHCDDFECKVLLEIESNSAFMGWAMPSLVDISLLLARSDKWDSALKMANELFCESDKIVALCGIASELFKAGRKDEFYKLMDDALITAKNFSGYVQQLISYHNSEREFTEIEIIEGRVIGFIQISSTLRTAGDNNKSYDILSDALALTKDISDKDCQSRLNGQISVEHVLQQRVEEALQIVKQITNTEDAGKCLIDIAAALCKSKRFEEAQSVLNEATLCLEAKRGQKNQFILSVAYAGVLWDMGKADESYDILGDLLKLHFEHIGPVELTALATEFFRQGNYEEAFSTIGEINDFDLQLNLLADLAGCFAAGAHKEQSKNLIEDFTRTLIRNKKKALEVEIQNDYHKFMYYCSSGQGLWRLSMQEEYIEFLLEALKVSCGLIDDMHSSIIFKDGALTEVVRGLVDLGEIDEAVILAGACMDEDSLASAKHYIIDGLLVSGSWQKAFDIFSNFKVNYWYHLWELSDFIKIFETMINLELIDEAIEKAGQVEDNGARAAVLKNISAKLFQLGKKELATSCLDFALSSAVHSDNKSEILAEISLEMFDQGKTNDAINIAMTIENDRYKNEALNDICLKLLNSSKYEQALSIAEAIKNDQVKKNDLIIKVAVEMSRSGKSKQALTILKNQKPVISEKILLAVTDIACDIWNQGEKEDAKGLFTSNIERALKLKGVSNGTKFFTLLKISNKLWTIKENAWADNVVDMALDFLNSPVESYKLGSIVKEFRRLGRNESVETLAEYFDLKSQLNDEPDPNSIVLSTSTARYVDLSVLPGYKHNGSIDLSKIQVDNPESIIEALNRYALNQIFFGNPSGEMIQRLNKTLNIQWALDIANSLPHKKEEMTAFNVTDWIAKFSDEDDREQVELWARQVIKGKLTGQQFNEKLKELTSLN